MSKFLWIWRYAHQTKSITGCTNEAAVNEANLMYFLEYKNGTRDDHVLHGGVGGMWADGEQVPS
jgi:hypothetical protein